MTSLAAFPLPRWSDAMRATVRDAMSTDVASISRHASINEAERLLLRTGFDELFVTSEQGLLLGVLPDYALLKRRMTGDVQTPQTVESLMSRRFLVISADSPLTVAGRYLREHVHRRLAVVDDMRLIGQVTRRSVLRLLSTGDANVVVEPVDDGTQRRRDGQSTLLPKSRSVPRDVVVNSPSRQ